MIGTMHEEWSASRGTFASFCTPDDEHPCMSWNPRPLCIDYRIDLHLPNASFSLSSFEKDEDDEKSTLDTTSDSVERAIEIAIESWTKEILPNMEEIGLSVVKEGQICSLSREESSDSRLRIWTLKIHLVKYL